jgi:dihydrofolate reductase
MSNRSRKIVAFDRVSADGYFSAPDGNLNWAVPDQELDKAAVDQSPDGNTILFGRRTYDMFEKFWPSALDDSPTSPDPHAAGRRTPEMRAMAVWINNAQKLVFSKTRKDVTWKNSRLFHDLDFGELETLKRQPGQNMMIFGSGSIVSQLTERGLIDEYEYVISPILLGKGRSLIDGVTKNVPLELLEVKQTKAGNVLLRYAPRR